MTSLAQPRPVLGMCYQILLLLTQVETSHDTTNIVAIVLYHCSINFGNALLTTKKKCTTGTLISWSF